MPRLRFVKNVSDEAKAQLTEAFRNAPDFAFRQRAHAVLLSTTGHTINQLQAIFDVDRDTVTAWFDRFEAGGVEGLKSLPKPGRPPIYTPDEVNQLKALVGLEPRQIKQAQAALQQATGKTSCTATLKRALKSRRDPDAFAREQANQKDLQALAGSGLIDLYHFDESGFATVPCVPYAWQPLGTTLALPSVKSKRLNVLGFLSKDGGAFFRHAEEPVDSGQVVAAFDAFAAQRAAEYAVHGRPYVVNASWHTSRAFLDRTGTWANCGVVVHYLPPYSPELNAIEILWRKIKYEWLPLDCYASYQTMKSAVLDILDGVGSKYQICFV